MLLILKVQTLARLALSSSLSDGPGCEANETQLVDTPAADDLYDSASAMDHYSGNAARYLVDLHDARARGR